MFLFWVLNFFGGFFFSGTKAIELDELLLLHSKKNSNFLGFFK